MSISPERWLLQSIASGELDVHLPAIARAIDARQHLLHTNSRRRDTRGCRLLQVATDRMRVARCLESAVDA
jgi:hypothetical protein